MTGEELAYKDLVKCLWETGFLAYDSLADALKASARTLKKAIKAYQIFHGLKADGVVGPVTERSMEAPRFCGLPDVMEMGSDLSLPRWPSNSLTWTFTNTWPQIPKDQLIEMFRWAFAQWEMVCNLHFNYVEGSAAHIRIQTGRIDNRGGTLAWSELANGNMNPKDQKYDSDEPWVFSETPTQFTIDLGRVAAHEIGHVIGIPHIESGNLLAPIYSSRIRTPQGGDIRQAQTRYGPPQLPPPDPGGEKTFMVTISGTGELVKLEATGFRVTPLLQEG